MFIHAYINIKLSWHTVSPIFNSTNYYGIPIHNEPWQNVTMLIDWKLGKCSGFPKVENAIQSRLHFASANSISVCNWFGCVRNLIRTEQHTHVNKILCYCCLPSSDCSSARLKPPACYSCAHARADKYDKARKQRAKRVPRCLAALKGRKRHRV